MPTDTIMSIYFISNILIFFCVLILICIFMQVERKLDEYKTETEYLKSVCEQAIKISEQTELKIVELEKKAKTDKTKTYFQGIMSERKKK